MDDGYGVWWSECPVLDQAASLDEDCLDDKLAKLDNAVREQNQWDIGTALRRFIEADNCFSLSLLLIMNLIQGNISDENNWIFVNSLFLYSFDTRAQNYNSVDRESFRKVIDRAVNNFSIEAEIEMEVYRRAIEIQNFLAD